MITLACGTIRRHDLLAEIERTPALPGAEGCKIASISMIPFCQMKERGFPVADGGEKILSLIPEQTDVMDVGSFLSAFSRQADIRIEGELTYNFTDDEFTAAVGNVIRDEICNGAGSNFLLSRKTHGKLNTFSTMDALAVFARLCRNESSAYMTYCFFDGERYFIGASPERHLLIEKNIAHMNPICGTLSKASDNLYSDLTTFLQDEKEINELFMVVDETLKMMMPLCPTGGDVIGPYLREMRSVIHTENELCGKTELDVIDAFRATMFAPTMVGSPLESASRVILRHERGQSRRYYSSAIMVLGTDKDDASFLDSAITIRTIEIEKSGTFTIQSGASIVRDSVPVKETAEITAKAKGLLKTLTSALDDNPILHELNDDSIQKMLRARNDRLSPFWINNQSLESLPKPLTGKKIFIINNEDDFVFMAGHILSYMGANVTIKDIRKLAGFDSIPETDLIILGPGPGDPTDLSDPKIAKLNGIAARLMDDGNRSFFGICLGHQIISHQLGLTLVKLPFPRQGVQANVNFFGTERKLGFYNTFSSKIDNGTEEIRKRHNLDIAADEGNFIHAIRGRNFASLQAHPESILSRDGYDVLQTEILRILPR